MLQALNNSQGRAKREVRVDNATPKTKATGEQIAASPVSSRGERPPTLRPCRHWPGLTHPRIPDKSVEHGSSNSLDRLRWAPAPAGPVAANYRWYQGASLKIPTKEGRRGARRCRGGATTTTSSDNQSIKQGVNVIASDGDSHGWASYGRQRYY